MASTSASVSETSVSRMSKERSLVAEESAVWTKSRKTIYSSSLMWNMASGARSVVACVAVRPVQDVVSIRVAYRDVPV